LPESPVPPAPSFLESAGILVYRLRGVLPVPLAVTVVVLSWRAHIEPGPGGAAVDSALNLVGLGLCLVGAVARFCTIARVPAGSSGNSRTLAAPRLNTEGPYAVVRHPLYLANALLVVGLLCIAHTPWAWALGLGYFALTSFLITRAEEALLARTFGDAWREWAARVPAWVPRVSALPTAFAGPCDVRRAALREVNTLVAWGMGAGLLLGWEWWARGRLYGVRGQALGTVLVTLLALWPVGKVLRWRARAR
jgi:protein-S-isoprenylcysteine O-methyltransferase Ste14